MSGTAGRRQDEVMRIVRAESTPLFVSTGSVVPLTPTEATFRVLP